MSGDDMEERLRSALRAVAELPGHPGPASGQPAHRGRHRPSRLLTTLVAVVAIAAAVSLAIAFGPHSAGPRDTHAKVPATQPTTSTCPKTESCIGEHPTTTTPTTTPTPTATPTPTTTTPTPTTTPTTAPPSPPVGTQQITYEPFVGSQLSPSLHVTGQESGPCYQFGGGADGRYYYRCGTVQPCFAPATATGTAGPFACPTAANPTTNGVLMWTPTSVNTTDFTPATTKTPWAVQLSDGAVCALVSAAWSGLGPFGCTGGTSTGGSSAAGGPADCRQPQSAVPYWTTECQAQLTQASPFTSTTVVKVWF